MKARKVHLYGALAKRFGKTHTVVVGTITEALRVIECNHPGFIQAMRRMRFHVAHGHRTIKHSTEVQLHQMTVPRSSGDWHLVPVAAGAKSRTAKTIFSVVVGGALLATGIGGALGAASLGSFGSAGLAAGLTASSGFLGLSYGTIALLGAGFFLGGINMLLSPTPKTDTSQSKPTSFTFSGPEEREDEGGAIPIVLGEVICSGVRIASAITSTAGAAGYNYGGAGYAGGSVGGGGEAWYGGGAGTFNVAMAN